VNCFRFSSTRSPLYHPTPSRRQRKRTDQYRRVPGSHDSGSLWPPWAGMSHGSRSSKHACTDTLSFIGGQPHDPRMRAQPGKFLVGGLNVRTAGRGLRSSFAECTLLEYQDVASVGVNFLRERRSKQHKSYPAIGWTVEIDSSWKPKLRELLDSRDIRADTMYPPLREVRRTGTCRGKTKPPNASGGVTQPVSRSENLVES